MQPKFWKRLDGVEQSLQPDEDKSGVVIFPLKGESDEEYSDRIAKWKAGEEVEGIDPELSDNGKRVGVVRFVATKK